MTLDPTKVLAHLPAGLRAPLLQKFEEIVSNYLEHRWTPQELFGGHFCEVVYSIVEGAVSGNFPVAPSKPANMAAACRTLENVAASSTRAGDHSLRVLIPRMLVSMYDVRNNRGVGHVSGDVDPNFLDATAVYGMASWVLAELIRIFHGIPIKDAQETVDALIERKVPLLWEVGDIKRVLDPAMTKRDQVLLILNQRPAWVSEEALREWVEHSNPSVFRKKILGKLHSDRLIEYDEGNRRARISPLGAKEVEHEILKSRVTK